jgi:hypothetical protein
METKKRAEKSAFESVGTVVDRLRARRDEISQGIYLRIQGAVPDRLGGRDPTYQAGLFAAVVVVLDYGLQAIEHGPERSAQIPVEAAAQARRAARAGVSLSTVLRRYVAGHKRLGEFVEEETDRIGLLSNGAALHHIHRTRDALLEHLMATVAHEYAQELDRVGRFQDRLEIVKRLLSGDPVDSVELAELDYELNASWHLGLVATGTNAEDAVRRLNVGLSHMLLQVSCNDETVWAWLGGPQKLAVTDIERLLATNGLVGVSLGAGEPARGIKGWRQTHRSAQVAHLVARRRPHGRLTRYLDVALEATALQDEALGEALIDGYLSPLDDEHGGGFARRRTLRAIFDAEHNISSAASALKVNRRTVHRWLGEIERRLGYRLHEHQAEIEIALRLERLREDH